MSQAKDAPTPDTLPSSPLPALPEAVEEWLTLLEERDPQPLAVLSRRTATRWIRVAAIKPNEDDAGAAVLMSVSQYCVEHGPTTWQLSAKELEAVSWVSTIDLDTDVPVISSSDPKELMRAAWDITFRCAREMTAAVSAAPRLMTSIGGVYREALATLREVGSSNERAELAAIQAAQSSEKLDKVMAVLGLINKDKKAAPQTTASGKPADATSIVRRLLDALTETERGPVLSSDVGRALLFVTDRKELSTLLPELWKKVADGSVPLSKETKDKAREIVKDVNE